MKLLITLLCLTAITASPTFAKEDMTVQSCKDVEGLTTTKIRELHGSSDKYNEQNVQYWNDNVYAVFNKKAITVTKAVCIPLKPEQQVKAFPVPIKQFPTAEVESVKKVMPEIKKLAEIVNKGMDGKRAFDNYFKPFIEEHYKTPFNQIPNHIMQKTFVFYALPTFNFQSVQDILTENGYTVKKVGATQMEAAKNGIIYNIYIPSSHGQKYAGNSAKLQSVTINNNIYYISVKEIINKRNSYEAFIATQKIIEAKDIGRNERVDLAAYYREYGLSFKNDINKGYILLVHNSDGIADVEE